MNTSADNAPSIRRIASAARVVGAGTLASRVLGFVRDMAFAWLFGTGMVGDAFFAAFRIPGTLRELLAEGALSVVFVPAFTRTLTREGRAATWSLAGKVLGTLLAVLAGVTAIGVVAAPHIAALMAYGFSAVPGKLALTATLLRIMFPYLFLVGCAALFMAVLNACGHFLAPALSPVVLNLCIIAAAVGIAPRSAHPALVIAVAVLVGGVGQLGLQLWAAWTLGWRPALRFSPHDPAVHAIGRLMLPGVGGLAVTQVNVLVGTLLASFLPEGNVAAMTYAFRLVQFPIGVVGVAIATGALPVLAAAVAREAGGDYARALTASLRMAIFLTLPAMAGLIVFRTQIVAVLFERGAFARPATLLTASILAAYAAGLLFYVANRILAPAFYSLQDTWTPVTTGAVSVAVNAAASLVLMPAFGAVGIALATALASGVNCLQLVVRLRRRFVAIGGGVLWAGGKAAVATLSILAISLLGHLAGAEFSDGSAPMRAVFLFGQLVCAAGLFLLCARLLQCEELEWALKLFRKRRPQIDKVWQNW